MNEFKEHQGLALCSVAGPSHRERVRSSDICTELGVKPLFLSVKRSQLRWLGDLIRMPPGCPTLLVFRWHDKLRRDFGPDPGPAGVIIHV